MTNKVHQKSNEITNDLHRDIMNMKLDGSTEGEKVAIRDARHSAAEMALWAGNKFDELLDSVVETYVVAIVDDHEIIADIAATEEQAQEIVLAYAQREYDYDGETYDASDLSDYIGSMGASLTWTIQKKMNPHFMEIGTTHDAEEDNTVSLPSP
jgi:predicted DsbA family dithiol-disulfide isomerase